MLQQVANVDMTYLTYNVVMQHSLASYATATFLKWTKSEVNGLTHLKFCTTDHCAELKFKYDLCIIKKKTDCPSIF